LLRSKKFFILFTFSFNFLINLLPKLCYISVLTLVNLALVFYIFLSSHFLNYFLDYLLQMEKIDQTYFHIHSSWIRTLNSLASSDSELA